MLRRMASCLILLFCVMISFAEHPRALLLNLDGAITPASAIYVHTGLQKAEAEKFNLLIIQMDTPGGLDKSMRMIIQDILSSTVPIVSYVAPSGARAASAGTYILYASHVAAMAPGTNLGAASPVSALGGDSEKPGEPTKMEKKISNDAIAYIRSLAQIRGRNIQFAELAVKEASTLTAEEAKKQNVIEIVATNIPDLLQQLNGKTIKVQGTAVTLNTTAITVETLEPNWRVKFLAMITDPSVAYILLLLGVYGLFFEFSNPGMVAPGVIGGISLLLALYAFQLLPISFAGLGLIFLGMIFMIMEAFLPSFGSLGVGGVIAFIVGSVLLYDPSVTGYRVAWPLILSMAATSIAILVVVVGMAVRARDRKIVTGQENLIGQTGILLEDCMPEGSVIILGERWRALSKHPLKAGEKIKVIDVRGLLLIVTETKE